MTIASWVTGVFDFSRDSRRAAFTTAAATSSFALAVASLGSS